MLQPTLENVVNDLTRWRQTRTKKGPIPDALREKISTLSSRYRTTEITAALGLNTGQLKLFSKARTKKTNPPVKFVRVDNPIHQNIFGKIACHLKRPDGATLECTLDSNSLTQLIGDFLCSR